MMMTADGLRVAYKNERLSDTRIQIWKWDWLPLDGQGASSSSTQASLSEAGPASKRAKRDTSVKQEAPDEQPHWQSSLNRRQLVEELPGHKLAFYGASPYFRAKIDQWEHDHGVISLDVSQHEVSAARALVYFVYHGCLPSQQDTQAGGLADAADQHSHHHQQGIDNSTVCKLAVIAKRYDMMGCVTTCVNHLAWNMSQGDDVEAALDMLELLSELASVNGVVDTILEAFQQNYNNLRAMFQEELGSETSPHFHRAVSTLFEIFRRMDKVWGQDRYRDILHMCPAAVVQALFAQDELECMSENVIASAITEWLEQQASSDVCPSTEQQLLHLIRIPFLSATYRMTVLTRLPWICRHHSEEVDNLLICTNAALAAVNSCGGNKPTKPGFTWPGASSPFTTPRQYKGEWQGCQLEWDFKWADIEREARGSPSQNRDTAAPLGIPCRGTVHSSAPPAPTKYIYSDRGWWHNGVQLKLGLMIEDQPVLPNSPTGAGSRIRAFWCWEKPYLNNQEEGKMISGRCIMSFCHADDSQEDMGSEDLSIDMYDELADNVAVQDAPQGLCEVYAFLPSSRMREYAQDDWSLRVKCSLSYIV